MTLKLYPEGFHGDHYLQKVFSRTVVWGNYFIETGGNIGSTVVYVARKFPKLQCFTCEPNPSAYELLSLNSANFYNIKAFKLTSLDYLKIILEDLPSEELAIFWLDAHGGSFEWPLKDEVGFITSNLGQAIIFIDDFKVPGCPWFGFDSYADQECSLELIRDSLNPVNSYRYYFPRYRVRTSNWHPLRGWMLLTYGLSAEAKSVLDSIRWLEGYTC